MGSPPYCKKSFVRNIKKYCTHISGLCMRLSDTSGPEGIRAFCTISEYRPQWTLDPSRFLGMQVLPFMPSLKILSTQSDLTLMAGAGNFRPLPYGDKKIMFLKAEDSRWIMHEDVGI